MEESRIQLLDLARGVARTACGLLHPARLGLPKYSGLTRESQTSIGTVLEYWARHTPRKTALRFEDQSWSYQAFNEWANRVAAVLASRGVGSGDTVALMMENRAELLVCVAATVKLGAVAGMLNHNQRGDLLAHSIRLIKPKALVISAECRDAIESTSFTPAGTPTLSCLWHGGDGKAPAPAGWLDLDQAAAQQSAENPTATRTVKAGQGCYYVFTSGTTGLPKASVMTHFRWLSALDGIGAKVLQMRRDDVFYCCLPMYHNNALTVSWASTMSAGACFAMDRKFSATRFWDRIRHYDATAFCYVGELLRYLLNQPASDGDRRHRLRKIVGNGLRPEIWDAFEQRFGIRRIHEFYGASESGLAFVNAFGLRRTAGFSPSIYAIVEFDNEQEQPVRDGNGMMRRVSKGGVGLLLGEVTTQNPFEGYTDKEASEKKLFRDVFAKGDCWFNTGDLVRDQGFRHIQFVDRVGDTFRWKGENVATSEVEAAVGAYPDIEHAVVYGVAVPGTDGRAGMAAITLRVGKAFDGAALARHVIATLPPYAVPLFLRIKAEQETTGTFKYRKVELKADGFDPAKIAEPLYALIDRERGYEPVTPSLHARIRSGSVRL